MINYDSISKVREREYQGYRLPSYDEYSFYNLVRNIPNLYNLDEKLFINQLIPDLSASFDSVIVFLFDAFGWRFMEEHLDKIPLLKDFRDNGRVSMLSTLFPSTTAAHVTYLNTAVPPWESGIYEWNNYLPDLNRIIKPLTWSLLKEKKGSLTTRIGVKTEEILPKSKLYQELLTREIEAGIFLPKSYADTPYNKAISEGASIYPYQGLIEGFDRAREFSQRNNRTYALIYSDILDILLHRKGPNDHSFHQAITDVLAAYQQFILEPLRNNSKKRTLLLIIADHGGVSLKENKCIYLDQLDKQLIKFIKKDLFGEPLVPCGSSRDLFLHVEPQHIKEVKDRLINIIGDQSLLLERGEAEKLMILAPEKISLNYQKATGEIIIFPQANKHIYWSINGKFNKNDLGSHGGLAQDEVEVPCLAMVL